MRKLWGVAWIALMLAFVGCSSGAQQERSVQSDSLFKLSTAILANDWEATVGYDRMLVLVRGILKDWRDQGQEVYSVSADKNEEAELWTQLVLMYFSSKEGRDSTLLEAMEFFRANQEKLKEPATASTEKDVEPATEGNPVSGNKQTAKTDGEQALGDAIFEGDIEEVGRLLQQGADPNANDAYDIPMLLAAIYRADMPSDMPDPELLQAGRQKSLKIVELLLAHGADPNARNPEGDHALVAASSLLPDACVPLLEAGADPNATDRFGNSALYYAVDDPRLFKQLLKHGVNPDTVNNEGATVYDRVRERNAVDTAGLIGMELEEQELTPPSEDASIVFHYVKNGLTPAKALTAFGKKPYKFTDELDGSEVWAYAYAQSGLKQPVNAAAVGQEDLAAGEASLMLYLYWTKDRNMAYCMISVPGPDHNVYGYTVLPGDRKAIGSIVFVIEP